MNAPPYPIQLDLRSRRVLVAGAGHVATRKLRGLVRSGAVVRVIAPVASEAVQAWARAGALTWDALALDAEGCAAACAASFMVVCATDRPALNAALARAGRAAGALVLRVDAPEDSDFSVPARALGNHVDATVSTHGRAPSASRRLGAELRAWVASGPERFVEVVAAARGVLKQHADADARLRALSDGPLFDACRRGDEAHISALLSAALEGAS